VPFSTATHGVAPFEIVRERRRPELLPSHDQLVLVTHWQRAQKYTLNEREHDGCCGDADREGEHGDAGKTLGTA
jgi:hypothetical protein